MQNNLLISFFFSNFAARNKTTTAYEQNNYIIFTGIVTMIMNFLFYDKFVFGKTKTSKKEDKWKS